MKTTICLIAALCWLCAACNNDKAGEASAGQPATDSTQVDDTVEITSGSYFIKRYKGKLDGQFPISMVLVNWGDGFLSGRYWYEGKNSTVQLNGELSDSLSFQITESVNFKETGTFEGVLQDPTRLSGTWANAKRSKKMQFDLVEEVLDDSIGWTGDWHLNEIWDVGLLLIGNVRADSFDFALSIVRSSHLGTVEGQAKIMGNKAIFNLKDFEDEPCKISFAKFKDYIVVEQVSTNFACGFGARAHATGKYERKHLLKKAKLAYGPGEEAIFPNKETHDAFNNLVGNEAYSVFAFNMQLTEKTKSEAPEKLKATVVTGFISGLVGSNEAIIMYDDSGKFWAATIDLDQTNNESLVRYFTNDPLYSGKLPYTIEDWREGFKSYRVVFGAAPL